MSKLIVLEVIKELGPITSREVSEQLGISNSYGRACVSYCKKRKWIHIASYIRNEENGGLYPRPQYVHGPGRDAKKLDPISQQECRKRYIQKKYARVSSVFDMGLKIDERRVTTRKRPDVVKRRQKPLGVPEGG